MTNLVSSSTSLATSVAVETAAAQPSGRQAPSPQTEAAAKVDTVEISARAAAAQVMLAGARKAAADATANPALDQLTQDVVSGQYHPPAEAVARSLARYEGQLAKLSSGLSEQFGANPAK